MVAEAARSLAAAGVGEGDRVATDLVPGLELAALLHALPRLGAVLVPLAPGLPHVERELLLDVAEPALIVGPRPQGGGADRVERLESVWAGSVHGHPRGAVLPGPDATPHPTLASDAPHTLIFTSGSTGTPRPVELTYANHLASARASAANLGVDPGDRWLCPLPLHHVGGLAVLLRSGIHGTAAIVHAHFEADAVSASLESGEATLVSLVPTQLRRLVAAGLERAPALRAVLLGGGPVARDLLAWAAQRGLPVLQTYGMTETASQIASLSAAEALASKRRGSAGRALDGVELRIAPADGEVLVRGPMVSGAALAGDGWLHTGDRGALDADGYLWIEGRLDDVILTGGENVAAAEVEAALEAHPAVAEAAVVGRPDAEWGEAVVAYVVLVARAGEPSEAELVAHCRGRLAPHKAPKEIHRLDRLPRTASGKVRRHDLGEPTRKREVQG